MRIDIALIEVHDAETDLAQQLLQVGERHQADHDVFHLTRTMSGWATERLHRLATHSTTYGVPLDPDTIDRDQDRGILALVREKGAELVGHRPEPAILLLRDIRDLHLAAARVSLGWTMLGQGAQAVQDSDLMATVTACHPEAIRTMKWTVQKMKEASPQVLAS